MPLGVGQKIAMLRELCGSGRSDVELENLLKETRYDFNRAVEQLLDQSEQSPDQSGDQPCSPLPAEMRRGDDCATQSQKRHRSTAMPDHPSTEQPACTPVQQSTEQQSTEQLQQMNALMRALGEAVITPITKLISALPAQFAAAVRKHDEDEAVRLAAAAQATPHPIHQPTFRERVGAHPSLIPSHLVSSHPNPSHPIPSHSIPSQPIPPRRHTSSGKLGAAFRAQRLASSRALTLMPRTTRSTAWTATTGATRHPPSTPEAQAAGVYILVPTRAMHCSASR